MNQFIIYLTAGTHIESAAKHSVGLSLVVIITCSVWALPLKVRGVQYSSSEKYLFEITNICVWLIHAVHYFFIILFLLFFLFSVCFSPFWALPAGRSSGAAAWQRWLCTCSSGRGDVSIFLSDSWLLSLGCFYLSWKSWYELTPLMKIVLLSPSLPKLLEWCLTSVFRCLRSPEQTRLNLKFMYCVWL